MDCVDVLTGCGIDMNLDGFNSGGICFNGCCLGYDDILCEVQSDLNNFW